ncbi:MAG TPA: hypothetical protein VKU85_15810, partial [bacterium]|nr:hypothetical protein [bacterium]
MSRFRSSPPLVAAVLAAASVPLLAAAAVAQDAGRGTIGEWELLWAAPHSGHETNRWAESTELEFPYHVQITGRGDERHLALYDEAGHLSGTIRLAPDESAMASADGGAYLIWSADPASTRLFHYRYYRIGEPEPNWEASSPGEPRMIAPDGSYFVIASAETGRDAFQRTIAG